MSDHRPQGFRFAGVHCGLKQSPSKQDLSLIVSDRPCVAVGVFTQNQVVAAPVILDRERTPSDQIRVIVTNSGNANACTGERGLDDARRMAALAAQAMDVDESHVLVLSTGIIGEHLPMQKIDAGIRLASQQLRSDSEAIELAARGMMTTDTRPKVVSRHVDHLPHRLLDLGHGQRGGDDWSNMATMLGIVLTDAPLEPDTVLQLLRSAVNDSFNCISVEGHMSTNDTVLLLGNGAADGSPLTGEALDGFAAALRDVCMKLAQEIANDGEGATHLIEVHVTGCETREDAHRIAKSIADSPLVKTAVAGADPNWGRIVSAAGYAGVAFDPATVQLSVNDFTLFRQGTPLAFDATEVSSRSGKIGPRGSS